MAELKDVKITGDELKRRVQVTVEYAIHDTETMFNSELVKAVAAKVAAEYVKKAKPKIDFKEIEKRLMDAIIRKAIFNLALEEANDQRRA